jgi:hypothetical protein
MLKLRHLVSLDLTANSIKDISIFGDPSANKLDSLKELKLAQNQVGVENKGALYYTEMICIIGLVWRR